jgi:prepilin-type processing-associated H-X9-DG protein
MAGRLSVPGGRSTGREQHASTDRTRGLYRDRASCGRCHHRHPTDLSRFGSECHGVDPQLARLESLGKGLDWTRGGFGYSLYNHIIGINDHTCTNAGLVDQGAWTAGSAHPFGANTLFADGHVAFVKDSISLQTWRALGTRNGGEAVSEGPP